MLPDDSLLEREIAKLSSSFSRSLPHSDLVKIRRAMVNYAIAAQMDSKVRQELDDFMEFDEGN